MTRYKCPCGQGFHSLVWAWLHSLSCGVAA
jgi:hypothetical protein